MDGIRRDDEVAGDPEKDLGIEIVQDGFHLLVKEIPGPVIFDDVFALSFHVEIRDVGGFDGDDFLSEPYDEPSPVGFPVVVPFAGETLHGGKDDIDVEIFGGGLATAYGTQQGFIVIRLEQVVHAACFESLDGVFVEGGGHDDLRRDGFLFENLKGTAVLKLHVHEYQVGGVSRRSQPGEGPFHRFGNGDDLDIGEIPLQRPLQGLLGQFFVFNDQGFHFRLQKGEFDGISLFFFHHDDFLAGLVPVALSDITLSVACRRLGGNFRIAVVGDLDVVPFDRDPDVKRRLFRNRIVFGRIFDQQLQGTGNDEMAIAILIDVDLRLQSFREADFHQVDVLADEFQFVVQVDETFVLRLDQVPVDAGEFVDEAGGLLVLSGDYDAVQRVQAVEQEMRFDLLLEPFVAVLCLVPFLFFVADILLRVQGVGGHPQDGDETADIVDDDVHRDIFSEEGRRRRPQHQDQADRQDRHESDDEPEHAAGIRFLVETAFPEQVGAGQLHQTQDPGGQEGADRSGDIVPQRGRRKDIVPYEITYPAAQVQAGEVYEDDRDDHEQDAHLPAQGEEDRQDHGQKKQPQKRSGKTPFR